MRRPHALDVVLLVLGLAMVGVSGVMARWTSEWAQAALLTFGAAVVLGVALRWVAAAVREATARATTAADQATTAATTATQEASEAREHAEAAAASEERARESLETLDERIAAAMAQDQLPVIAAARAAAEAQTPSTLRGAIVTAREVGSLGSVPPMVPVVDGGNFWVRVDTTETGVKVQLGRRRQPPGAPWIEMTDDDTEGRLIEFGQQLQSYAPELQPRPQQLLADVADLLDAGGRHSDRFGLFARFGDWGAAPGYVIYLGTDPEIKIRSRAVENTSNRAANAPRGLPREELQQFISAQTTALAPAARFGPPK